MNRIMIVVVALFSLASVTRAEDVSLDKAKALFARYVQYEHDYNAALTNLYSDTALIQNTRHLATGGVRVLKIPMKDYQQMIRSVMPLAKEHGDRSTYSDTVFTIEGNNVRITAKCYSELRKYWTPLSLLVGPDATGKWLILEELSESQS